MSEALYTLKCLALYFWGTPVYWRKLSQPVIVLIVVILSCWIGHHLTVSVIRGVGLRHFVQPRGGRHNPSKWIGVFERAAISSLVLAGATSATLFVFAAKAALMSYRLKGAKDRKEFTEYVVVGTLISYLVALMFGYLGIYLLDVLV